MQEQATLENVRQVGNRGTESKDIAAGLGFRWKMSRLQQDTVLEGGGVNQADEFS